MECITSEENNNCDSYDEEYIYLSHNENDEGNWADCYNDPEYWDQVPEFDSKSRTYKSKTGAKKYLSYDINYDYVGIQYKYPDNDDIVVLLDIVLGSDYYCTKNSNLEDKIIFEMSDWYDIHKTAINKGKYFIVLAFPKDTSHTDIFDCMKHYVSRICQIKYKINDGQLFTNNIIDYEGLLVMDLKTFTFYNNIDNKKQNKKVL